MQTKAVVIKKQNTNECDQLITCYTEEFGKLKTVAKSILKSTSIQAMHLDIFNLVEFDLINGRGVPITTGAQVVNPFRGVKSSLAKTAVAYFFAEAVDKMIFENDKDDKLWSFLNSFLSKLDKEKINHNALLRQGQLELLDILGYFPEVNSCKACADSMDDRNFGAFNHLLGGMVCRKCFLEGCGGILISQNDFLLLNLQNVRDAETYQGERFQRSILDGMFEYIAESRFYSLELMSMVK